MRQFTIHQDVELSKLGSYAKVFDRANLTTQNYNQSTRGIVPDIYSLRLKQDHYRISEPDQTKAMKSIRSTEMISL